MRPTSVSLRPGRSGQSTISTQLSTLETRLGYHLRERGRSSSRLTTRGERLVDSARKLLGTLDVFSVEACKMGRILVGMLNLGLIGHAPISANVRISQAIERFQERDEFVHFMISVRPPRELEGLLPDNKVHMAIGYFRYRVSALDHTTIFHETQLAHTGRGYPPFRKAGDVTSVQALAYAWAWRNYPLSEVAESPVERPVTAVADSMEVVAMLVSLGRYLGYLPEYFTVPYVVQGLLMPLTPAAICYKVPSDIAVCRDARRDGLLVAFIADMRAAHV